MEHHDHHNHHEQPAHQEQHNTFYAAMIVDEVPAQTAATEELK